MYLARKRADGRMNYCLRESYPEDGRMLFRELFDLGPNPAAFINYPGGNSFYFDDGLLRNLANQGVADPDRELELIFFPFLKPDIQRIIQQMTHLGRKKRRDYSREAMARRQAGLHVFDRRRLFILRFGRLDSPAVILRPHKFLNVLLDKSRDEVEFYFQHLETRLRIREKKDYVYHSLNLARHFQQSSARLFPLGLDPEALDQAFIKEICRLNQDPDFIDPMPGQEIDPNRLSDYLIPYAVLWFDFEFGQRPPRAAAFDEFIRMNSQYRPPPPPPSMEVADACRIFELNESEFRALSKKDLARLYRRMALECHPDQGGDPETFIKLKEAYERLQAEK